MRKTAAVSIFILSFFVFFVDELYRLRQLEWVPNVLGPSLIALSMYVWNPGGFSNRSNRRQPARYDGQEESRT